MRTMGWLVDTLAGGAVISSILVLDTNQIHPLQDFQGPVRCVSQLN
jgi:hypothetical protein